MAVKKFLFDHWSKIFVLLFIIWGVWGCWKVKELLIENVAFLSNLTKLVVSGLRSSDTIFKLLCGAIFLLSHLFWVTLPGIIALFVVGIQTSENKFFLGRFLDAIKSGIGLLLSMAIFILIWSLIVILYFKYGGILNLIFIIVMIGVFAFSVGKYVLGLFR